MIPEVRDWSRPNGLPMANAAWPTTKLADDPIRIGGGKRLVEAGGGRRVDAELAEAEFEEERAVAEETIVVAPAVETPETPGEQE